mmetsp:Transcript_21154/g.34107  ORF Transcript_21154/g.34107 Transcript_21154/m.34107 type:complete len:124 (+) Transcript_21154:58-429(+)
MFKVGVQDRIILVNLIQTLSLLVCSSGRSSTGTLDMCKGLFELLLTTRFHNTNEIRRESLKALGRIFDSVSETQIRYALREELEESVEWILITSKMDPDDVSRSLAAAIASNLLKNHRTQQPF